MPRRHITRYAVSHTLCKICVVCEPRLPPLSCTAYTVSAPRCLECLSCTELGVWVTFNLSFARNPVHRWPHFSTLAPVYACLDLEAHVPEALVRVFRKRGFIVYARKIVLYSHPSSIGDRVGNRRNESCIPSETKVISQVRPVTCRANTHVMKRT